MVIVSATKNAYNMVHIIPLCPYIKLDYCPIHVGIKNERCVLSGRNLDEIPSL